MNKKKFAVSAYIENDAHILLIYHVKQKAWVPVGGHIEVYESPVDAVSREVEEETGLLLGKDVALEPSLTSFQANMYEMPGLLAYEEHDVNPPGTVHLCFSFLLHATHTGPSSHATSTQTSNGFPCPRSRSSNAYRRTCVVCCWPHSAISTVNDRTHAGWSGNTIPTTQQAAPGA